MIATLDILGKTWPVVEEADLPEWGWCDHDVLRIRVRKDMVRGHLGDVLLHECVHAISYELGLNMNERQVGNTATALVQVLRANPELVAVILEGACQHRG